MTWAPAFLYNPDRFMAVSRWLAPILGVLAAITGLAALWLAFTAPEDYQQADTVRIMFIHVPAAWMCMLVYVFLAGASFLSFVFRHALADAAAKAAAPLGAGFTLITLVTGSLWGRPIWNTWWQWGDARLTSVLVLFLLYVSYMALRAALDDEAKAAQAAAILAMVGVINLPIIHFSVEWLNTLHQGVSVFRADGPAMPPVFWVPIILMFLAYLAAFGALWLVRIRAEVWRRRAEVTAMRAARA